MCTYIEPMQVMTDNDPYRSAYPARNPPQWSPNPHIYPHSHHGTPVHEYTAFNFGSSPPETNIFPSTMHQRPLPQQLQPLIMPQWPSMLNNQSTANFSGAYNPPAPTAQPVPISAIATPSSATSNRSSSTPRKTLTDSDRKRMCQYAEEHPTSKQTEIGAIFGVERSTVSKVLRQKEKYLFQDDGSRSPVKRAKGRSPDIERALANWAKNQEKKGLPLTDDLIRDKARAFAATTTTPENHVAMSASWIEKFKLRNNLMGARSRKSSLAPDDVAEIAAAVSLGSATATSTTSPTATDESPTRLGNAQSHESLKDISPDTGYGFSGKQPFHSHSTASLSSAFTDTAPSSFSPGPLSPTSPFFTPDSGVAPGPFTAPTATRGLNITGANLNSHRPRSQTFPLLDQYLINAPADSQTPKYTSTTHVMDSPMEEASNPIHAISEVLPEDFAGDPTSRPHTVTPADAMGPPPLPNALRDRTRSETPAMSTTSSQALTSPEEARNALQVVLSYFEQQPAGVLDLQESVTLGKLMEKLKPFA